MRCPGFVENVALQAESVPGVAGSLHKGEWISTPEGNGLLEGPAWARHLSNRGSPSGLQSGEWPLARLLSKTGLWPCPAWQEKAVFPLESPL